MNRFYLDVKTRPNGVPQPRPISSFFSTCILICMLSYLLLRSSSVVVPMYLGELAPPTLRGTLGTIDTVSPGDRDPGIQSHRFLRLMLRVGVTCLP